MVRTVWEDGHRLPWAARPSQQRSVSPSHKNQEGISWPTLRGVHLHQVPRRSQSRLNDRSLRVKVSRQASRWGSGPCRPRPHRQRKLFPGVGMFGRGPLRAEEPRKRRSTMCVCACGRSAPVGATARGDCLPLPPAANHARVACWQAEEGQHAAVAMLVGPESLARGPHPSTSENRTRCRLVGVFRPSQGGSEVSFSFKCPILRTTREEAPRRCAGGRWHGTQLGCCKVSAWEGVKLLPCFPTSENVLTERNDGCHKGWW